MEKKSTIDYIKTIAELRSISVAAENLGISQPALSTYLKKTEKELGVLLFDRSKQPLELTEAGRVYLDYLDGAKALQKKLSQNLADIENLKTGCLTVGGASFFNVAYVAKAVAVFAREYPGIDLEIVDAKVPELVLEAQRGFMDLFITPVRDEEDRFVYEELLEEKIYLAVPAEWDVNKELASNSDAAAPSDAVTMGDATVLSNAVTMGDGAAPSDAAAPSDGRVPGAENAALGDAVTMGDAIGQDLGRVPDAGQATLGDAKAIPLSRNGFRKLCECPFIVLKKDQDIGRKIAQLFEKYECWPERVITAEQTMTSLALTVAGAGISLITENSIRSLSSFIGIEDLDLTGEIDLSGDRASMSYRGLTGEGSLMGETGLAGKTKNSRAKGEKMVLQETIKLYLPETEICSRKIYIAYPKNKYLSKAARKFIATLKEENR